MIYLLVLSGLAVVVAAVTLHALGFTEFLRRARRLREWCGATATVIDVEPMDTLVNGGIGRPYTIRFTAPDGEEHVVRCPDGFGGAVPEKGATTRVRFDPGDPLALEVLDTPRPPRTRTTVPRMLGPSLAIAAGVVFLMLIAAGILGVPTAAWKSGAQLYMGVLLLLFGLATVTVALFHLVSDATWAARSQRVQGTVTDVWSTFRRFYDGPDMPLGLTHPFVVAFELPDGRRFHTQAPEVSAFFRPRRGRAVTVVYDANQPTSFHVNEVLPVLSLRHVTHIAIGVGFLAAGAASTLG